MPKQGEDVNRYFEYMKKRLPVRSTIRLCMEVLKVLEKVHDAGFVYGDLKLDNILLGSG
jgi:serine/threonine protein kinase